MSEELLLESLSKTQNNLFSIAVQLDPQTKKQEELTTGLIKYSNDFICELRLLSLVRMKISQSEEASGSIQKILQSQSFQGLKFSKLEYCPNFVSFNVLNYYSNLASMLHRNPKIFAEILYEYCFHEPTKLKNLSSSLLLTIFQQGWCKCEDELLYKVLKQISNLQFRNKIHYKEFKIPQKTRLKMPQVKASTEEYEPFATFFRTYLFNGSSFSYLQTLEPIIVKLYSLSQLCNIKNTFQTIPSTGSVAPFDYWSQILEYAIQVLNVLYDCLELLPRGVFRLMRHLKKLNVNIQLLFFECFINEALDNPEVLGLQPWHPSHKDWMPSKDIADIFRTKYSKSPSIIFKEKILKVFDDYDKVDLDKIINKICSINIELIPMIQETELLSINPNFPKEILIKGTDVLLLHKAALCIPKNKFPELDKALEQIQTVPEKNQYAFEHFKIVILRQKEVTDAAKNMEFMSLFSTKVFNNKTEKSNDPYVEQLCNIITEFPQFETLLSSVKIKKNYEEEMNQPQVVATIPNSQSKFRQQRLPACRPFLTPLSASFVYLAFFLVSLAFCIAFFVNNNEIFEKEFDYTNCTTPKCQLTINLTEKDMGSIGPFYVYYQLTNFYQNNFMYSDSINWDQLQGKAPDKTQLSSCSPMIQNGTNFTTGAYVPCGTLPMSVFNDTFAITGFTKPLSESGIASSGLRSIFKHPSSEYALANQWLDETLFPGNQTNEHFVNWVQTAPFSKFRKLWGIYSEDTKIAGNTITVEIQNNFDVSSFGGTKVLIIATLQWFGGKNNFYGVFFAAIAGFSFLAMSIFAILYFTNSLPLYKALASSVDGMLDVSLIS
ncbi:ALA-interacting subunit 3 [Histomonas meleagridis]|uniref:ALA-interacting subunit 3 n=1 Tax=Histomonas meleagridis TaxID=135588 RepID=UPI003559EB55|nr:ALA-interacting subunit 3 [Histomonas meleagridis]KAH0801262.1 ALA-interacting subunit 3 [Histomonas meleagridis]